MSTYSDAVLADTPLVYMRLGGTTQAAAGADFSGNGRTALAYQTPTYGQPSLLVSDTSDLSCYFPWNTGMQWASAAWMNVSSITLEAWILPSGIGGQTPHIWGRDSISGRDFQFRLEPNGKLGLIFWTSVEGPFIYTGSTTLVNGTTYHVAATYDAATGVAKTYVNGLQDGSWTVAANPLKPAPSNLTLAMGYSGASSPHSSSFFVGRVDEAAYYGAALSAARILAHYQAGMAEPATNDCWVWNGATELPANVTVWNGASEIAAGVEVTT